MKFDISQYSNIVFFIMIAIFIGFLAIYIFSSTEGFRRGGHRRFPSRKFHRKRFNRPHYPRGSWWNANPFYSYSYPVIKAPYCEDILCGNNVLGWDCCGDMKCKKGQHKCCSTGGRCRCCKN